MIFPPSFLGTNLFFFIWSRTPTANSPMLSFFSPLLKHFSPMFLFRSPGIYSQVSIQLCRSPDPKTKVPYKLSFLIFFSEILKLKFGLIRIFRQWPWPQLARPWSCRPLLHWGCQCRRPISPRQPKRYCHSRSFPFPLMWNLCNFSDMVCFNGV